MKFKELTIQTTYEGEELVADVLWQYTEYGVAVSSVKDVVELTENRRETYDYIDENLLKMEEDVSFVKGYFDIDSFNDTIKSIITDVELLKINAQGNFNLGTLEIVTRVVDGNDWIEIWRKHYKPINFGKITVCPRWLQCDTDNEIVYIDSNAAFGTGEHETTSMCLSFLEKYMTENTIVVDVGTGSGILGISAAKIGASSVYMTDNDPVACDAAKHNVEVNEVSEKCFVFNTNLLNGVEIKGNIVVANITADVLLVLSKTILSYVLDEGIIILSGILKTRLKEVKEEYVNLGFVFLEEKIEGEWSALVMKK